MEQDSKQALNLVSLTNINTRWSFASYIRTRNNKAKANFRNDDSMDIRSLALDRDYLNLSIFGIQ